MDSRTKDAAEAGRKRNLVLLDLVPGEESGQNDGADQERDHPVHVTHCCPLSMVCGGKRILLPALSRYGLLHFILLEGKSKGSEGTLQQFQIWTGRSKKRGVREPLGSLRREGEGVCRGFRSRRRNEKRPEDLFFPGTRGLKRYKPRSHPFRRRTCRADGPGIEEKGGTKGQRVSRCRPGVFQT